MRLLLGDCVEKMRELPEASIDSVVCDPPYNLSFMSRAWDSFNGNSVDPGFLHWFAGFVDGEGCFSVHKKNVNGYETYDCQFAISLRADDGPILERIHRTLGIGTLSKSLPHAGGNPQVRYAVSAKAQLVALRDIFRAFPLRAKKARDFELWSDALDAWLVHEPGDWVEMAEARAALMATREYVDKGVRIDPFQMWCWRWGSEALRVLKPGGHALVFGGTRTFHRLAAGLEDAGFEIRDCVLNITTKENVCRCGREALSEHDMRQVRGTDISSPLDSDAAGGEVLLAGVPEQGASPDGSLSSEGEQGEPKWLVEGRGHILEEGGELSAGQVRASAGLGVVDGAQGRLCDGAPSGDGGYGRAAAGEGGGGSPSGPQSLEQSAVEPGVVADERGPQTVGSGPFCSWCGKPRRVGEVVAESSSGMLAWLYGSG